MRTNIDLDDGLMKQAMKATGAATKRAAVDTALRRLVEVRAEEAGRKDEVRLRRGKDVQALADDWFEKWLASGWKSTPDRTVGLRPKERKTNANQH